MNDCVHALHDLSELIPVADISLDQFFRIIKVVLIAPRKVVIDQYILLLLFKPTYEIGSHETSASGDQNLSFHDVSFNS
jgi:predicted rRNA methylase YqxC with S4 and FtsJ domains